MRTNDETENELENRIEGVQDEEPGNQNATTTRTFPSTKVAKKPMSRVPFAGKKKGKTKVMRRPPPTASQKARSFGGMK